MSKAAEGMFFGPSKSPPPLRFIDGDPGYTVKRLMEVSCQGCGSQYLVGLGGYRPEERSWVSTSNTVDQELIDEFHWQPL